MEEKEIKKFRYRAWKLGLQFKRFKDGYRLYDRYTGDTVAEINGVDCSRVMTLDEIFLTLTAVTDKKKGCV